MPGVGNGSPGAPRTVLIADDEAEFRAIVREVLEAKGHVVLEAASGSEAVALADGHGGPIDLLITDVLMPGMSGWQLAERLLQQRPTLRVLYVSGYADDKTASTHARAAGIVLRKPVSIPDLERAVDDHLLGSGT